MHNASFTYIFYCIIYIVYTAEMVNNYSFNLSIINYFDQRDIIILFLLLHFLNCASESNKVHQQSSRDEQKYHYTILVISLTDR